MSLGKNLTKVQQAAYNLIQSDARFIYTLVDIQQNCKTIDTNFMLMSQPYIGIFADGAEQWSRKVGLNAPQFSDEEKKYYTSLRLSHKLFDLNYLDFMSLITEKLREHDAYFYRIRRFREKIFGYYNVGTDLYKGKYCGNTVLCDMYTPIFKFGDNSVGFHLRNLSVIVGKIASYFECTEFEPYKYNDEIEIHYRDFHFFKQCPLKVKTNFGFILFSILCCVNYVTEFIDSYFVEEIPQKLKFAYLLYYYLCDFVQDLNVHNNTNFVLNSLYKNRNFRNTIAHYGLGQYMDEDEIMEDDLLKGLTYKAFDMDYISLKKEIYKTLKELTMQIESYIFDE